jgi:hypothetical protein
MANAIELARLWVVKGTNDLLCADNNLQAKQIPFDTVCFHCQQAAEDVRDWLRWKHPELF